MKESCFKGCFCSKSARPSSPRSVAVRGIGAAPHLYPALQACGMTQCVARGFTLIELLVVVLIIGILAAVAVPQYQKAVMKSRVTQALVYGRAVKDAEEIYYLANGTYTNNLENLSIESVLSNEWGKQVFASPGKIELYYLKSKKGISYTFQIIFSFDHRSDYAGLQGVSYCWVREDADDIYKNICQTMGQNLGSTAGQNLGSTANNGYRLN